MLKFADPKVFIVHQSKKNIGTLDALDFLEAQQHRNRTTTSAFRIVPLGRKISV